MTVTASLLLLLRVVSGGSSPTLSNLKPSSHSGTPAGTLALLAGAEKFTIGPGQAMDKWFKARRVRHHVQEVRGRDLDMFMYYYDHGMHCKNLGRHGVSHRRALPMGQKLPMPSPALSSTPSSVIASNFS